MKKVIKLAIIMALAVNINFVYAENVVNEDTQSNNISKNNTTTQSTQTVSNTTTNSTTVNNTTTVKKETVKTTTKSNNADLQNLGIKPNDFSGFVSSKTNYSVSVPNTTKAVEVYAKTKDGKATVTGTGNIELKEGQNTASVVVKAEDGTTKTYTITITRLKAGEEVKQISNNSSTGLKTLSIEGMELEPQFQTDKYDYTVSFEGDQDSLNINAEGNNTSDIIQILGNESFIDGTNMVTIIVSDAKENQAYIYQVTVNKNIEKQKQLQKDIEDAQKAKTIQKWIVRILIFVIIFGLMAIIILKHKKLQLHDEEENNDLPKSLRKNSIEKEERKKKTKNRDLKLPKETTVKKRKKSKGKHVK